MCVGRCIAISGNAFLSWGAQQGRRGRTNEKLFSAFL